MTTGHRTGGRTVGIMLVLAALGGACTPPPGSELTGNEPNAVNAAVNGMAALHQAVYTAQNGAISISTNQQVINGDVEIGTCPVVTTSLSLGDPIAADLTIDFGDRCAPFGGDTYICSGSATGTFSQSDRQIDLTFDAFSCSDQTLSGSSSLVYSLTANRVAVAGSWDLTYAYDAETFGTAGAGSGEYDRDAAQTTISTFSGTVSDSVGRWKAQATDVVISLQNNETLLPSSGEVTLSGSDIRTIVVRFDEDTPATGLVQVSVNGSAFFTVGLQALWTVLGDGGG